MSFENERTNETKGAGTDPNCRNNAKATDENGAEGSLTSKRTGKTKRGAKKIFSAKRIAVMAVFTALAYVVSLFDFSLFPGASFLKLDFGNVFILLIGFLLGPVEGVIVCVIKELLHIPLGSTGGVGELANVIMTCSFILLPSIAYRFRKGLKVVVPSLVAACFIATGMALISNRFILLPAYGIKDAAGFFAGVWYYIVAFNLIKTVSISVLTLLFYKRLSNVFKRMEI